MCMIGKGEGQDATINPYSDKEFSYALIENIGTCLLYTSDAADE